jgi:hypothetical protein
MPFRGQNILTPFITRKHTCTNRIHSLAGSSKNPGSVKREAGTVAAEQGARGALAPTEVKVWGGGLNILGF